MRDLRAHLLRLGGVTMSEASEDFVERFAAQVESLVRRRAVIETDVMAWSGTNGRAGLEIRTPLHAFMIPLSIGACGRLETFLAEHVAWTGANTPGPTEEMVRDEPPVVGERRARGVDYNDHTPVDEATRYQFLTYFFFVATRDGLPLLSPDYVQAKIDEVYAAKELWQLEGMLHPAAIRAWRERRSGT